MAVDVRLACEQVRKVALENEELQELKTPGELITATPGFMRGHGTYTEEEKLLASVAGIVERYNKLAEVQNVFSDGSLSLHTRSLKYGKPVSPADRAVIVRLRNCVVALAESHMTLYDTSIIYAYEESLKYTVKDLLKPEVKQEVADLCRQRLEQES
ncbi:hypothetical protein LSH36_22g02009 [Paralvinella palmiformis]|uniref:Exosome complex component N-terminal domain-containing protein n=1 Tax=Paralvinella palmiformis TaxID=53620 RepID=A0AAD9KAW1_9ANNE|nr:hypothetical protein LSH36_22g02009 [Paralvinella palmiformis]